MDYECLIDDLDVIAKFYICTNETPAKEPLETSAKEPQETPAKKPQERPAWKPRRKATTTKIFLERQVSNQSEYKELASEKLQKLCENSKEIGVQQKEAARENFTSCDEKPTGISFGKT